jgi:hypothetical protein
MAALTADQTVMVYRDGDCGRTALISLRNTTAADTVDLAAWFKFVKRAGIVSDTGTTIASCTISSNTVVTIPTGPANDGVWLLAVGVAA